MMDTRGSLASYKKWFCTFADSKMRKSLKRIKEQAESMDVYDHILIYDETNLSKDFCNHFKEKLRPSRGYGYWCWKPQIILQTLEKMEDGDILQYTDAGCHLNKNGRQRLLEYFEIANLTDSGGGGVEAGIGILGFESKVPDDENLVKTGIYKEKYWTKGSLFDYFNVRDNPAIYDTEQIAATVIFIRKTKDSLTVIQRWLQVYYDDFSLADDSPSRYPNFPGFFEHRHDQSIFSLLGKIYNISTISIYEHFQLNSYFTVERLKNYPVWALRDKGFSIFTKIMKRVEAYLLKGSYLRKIGYGWRK